MALVQKKAEEYNRLNEIRQAVLLKLYEMQELPAGDVCNFVREGQ